MGATAYGGPAIAQHLKKAVVKDYGWLKEAEFMKGLALCQMTPGATLVMLSTYIGYRLRGIGGGIGLCGGIRDPVLSPAPAPFRFLLQTGGSLVHQKSF